MTPLEKKLIERIRSEGPIPFRDFMHAALYDSEFGYYNTSSVKIGPEGDYYTSSNVHPAFGAILAKCFIDLLRDCPSDEPLEITEIGAGSGQLALDIITSLRRSYQRGPGVRKPRYRIVEISPAMRALQQRKLEGFWDLVSWVDASEFYGAEPEPLVSGVVFSNEVVDAMPVHLVKLISGSLVEGYVTVLSERGQTGTAAANSALGCSDDGEQCRLALIWKDLSNQALIEYVRRFAGGIIEDQVFEVNLDALTFLSTIARRMSRGFVVTVDYGDTASHLYGADRRDGTLRAFHKHTLARSMLDRPGEQDITSSVNFSAFIEYGREFGLEQVSYERQTAFLMRHGLLEMFAGPADSADDTVEDLKDRLALKNLLVPGGISDNFRVLVQKKD